MGQAKQERRLADNEAQAVTRNIRVSPQKLNLVAQMIRGQKHIPVIVSEDMIGHKFGEFSPTRTYYGHGADKKAKRK